MVKKKSKKLKPMDHTELNAWKKALIRFTLGTAPALFVIVVLLKYLEYYLTS